jgi:hypothetical protein
MKSNFGESDELSRVRMAHTTRSVVLVTPRTRGQSPKPRNDVVFESQLGTRNSKTDPKNPR